MSDQTPSLYSNAPRKQIDPFQSFDAIWLGPSQIISTNSSSQQSSAVGSNCSIVKIFCTQDCYIAIGANPTASATTAFQPGGIQDYFAIQAGWKVAAVQVSVAGIIYITEGS